MNMLWTCWDNFLCWYLLLFFSLTYIFTFSSFPIYQDTLSPSLWMWISGNQLKTNQNKQKKEYFRRTRLRPPIHLTYAIKKVSDSNNFLSLVNGVIPRSTGFCILFPSSRVISHKVLTFENSKCYICTVPFRPKATLNYTYQKWPCATTQFSCGQMGWMILASLLR